MGMMHKTPALCPALFKEGVTKAKIVLFCIAVFVLCAGESDASQGARVVFIGDVMAHWEQIEGAGRGASWDFTHQFRRVKPLFENSLAAANLETVFAGERDGFAGYPSFNAPDELAGDLAELGVDIVTLANNHILDRRSKGAVRTIDVLEGAGVMWTGLGYGDVGPNEALTVEYSGLRWAFVNFSYGSNNPLPRNPASGDIHLNIISEAAVAEGLRSARMSSPDIIAACFHWGNEYQTAPTERQRKIAALCVKLGADLVIGTHPHVLQPIEIVSSDRGYGLVAYSLGNFVSFQRTLPRERSVVLAVDVEKKDDGRAVISRVSVAPTRVSATRQAGRRLIEVVYAGESPRFNHAGLRADELKKARAAGKAVLDFLGAAAKPDPEGFYTLWDSASPDILPMNRRKSPE
jgi:poly-gamma-glutamate synthesis protein (capsule biosynthesis protein)